MRSRFTLACSTLVNEHHAIHLGVKVDGVAGGRATTGSAMPMISRLYDEVRQRKAIRRWAHRSICEMTEPT